MNKCVNIEQLLTSLMYCNKTEAAIQAAFCTIAQVKHEEPCRKEMKDYISKVCVICVSKVCNL